MVALLLEARPGLSPRDIRALLTRTAKPVMTRDKDFQTGAGMNSPAVTFDYQGKQYVLAYAAGNTLAPSPQYS